MKTGRTIHSSGFHTLEIAGMLCFLLSSAAYAQREETFAERPGKRAERAQQARNRAEVEKKKARAWARSRGLEMRHDDGGRLIELLAVQDGRPVYNATFNDHAAVSTGADRVRNTFPYQVDGTGVRVGVWDGGLVMTNHQELAGRITAFDNAAAHYHATHVGGTIGASGVVARAEGMAPNVGIDSYDWNSDDAEMIGAAASEAGESGKIQLSNHSYGYISGWFYASFINPWTRRSGYHWWGDITVDPGEPFFGQYNSYARHWDEIVYDAPYFLPFKAAGNERTDNPPDGARVYYSPDYGTTWTNTIYNSSLHPGGDGVYKNGYDNIPAKGNAKNVMTVGAVYDAELDGERNIPGASNTTFTSWGPADDGRIKPDIVANGYSVYSCNVSGTASYASRSGTSMSAPNACGSAALLVDLYDNLRPGQALRASTLKGLIIHTADDLGRPGPDYQYGWGLMNVRAAAELLKDYADGNPVRLTEASLSVTNTVESFTCYADGGAPLRVTLCWTDPPGNPTSEHDNRTPALVNDLDLTVTGPDGLHYPFTLSYDDPEAPAAVHSQNRVDNIEQILISTPAAGYYTVTVDYEGALQNEFQRYSLLTSGVLCDSDGDGLPDNWEAAYGSSITGALAFADSDGDGMDNLSEYIAGSNPADPHSVFSIVSASPASPAGSPPFVITWDAMPGRIYNVYWTYNLVYLPFTRISGDLHWPVNSFTDTVEHLGQSQLYRIDVRMHE